MPFVKGQSGNPNGLNKFTGDRLAVKLAAQAMSLDALKVLKAIMRDKKGDKKARVAAAIAVLDRAVGKPKQDVAIDVTLPQAVRVITPLTNRLAPLLESPPASN